MSKEDDWHRPLLQESEALNLERAARRISGHADAKAVQEIAGVVEVVERILQLLGDLHRKTKRQQRRKYVARGEIKHTPYTSVRSTDQRTCSKRFPARMFISRIMAWLCLLLE